MSVILHCRVCGSFIVKQLSCLQRTGPTCRTEAPWLPPPAWRWRSCTRRQPGSRKAPAARGPSRSQEPSTATLEHTELRWFATVVATHTSNQHQEKQNHSLIGSLTIERWLDILESLSLQNLVKAVVCDLQDKTPVHHTVTGLETTVGHSMVVEVLHTLRQITLFYYGKYVLVST